MDVPQSPHGDVTVLLHAVRDGDGDALDRLVPLVYGELRAVAARQLRGDGAGATLQATALVHEAYVKLSAGAGFRARDRAHFLAIAARAMRQVLVDRARQRGAVRRGGGWARTELRDDAGAVDLDADALLALDAALEKLEPRQREVVEMRFFAGMEEAEIAEVTGVSHRTVRREWARARARLYRELYGGDGSAVP